jgi:hypothetical protein
MADALKIKKIDVISNNNNNDNNNIKSTDYMIYWPISNEKKKICLYNSSSSNNSNIIIDDGKKEVNHASSFHLVSILTLIKNIEQKKGSKFVKSKTLDIKNEYIDYIMENNERRRVVEKDDDDDDEEEEECNEISSFIDCKCTNHEKDIQLNWNEFVYPHFIQILLKKYTSLIINYNSSINNHMTRGDNNYISSNDEDIINNKSPNYKEYNKQYNFTTFNLNINTESYFIKEVIIFFLIFVTLLLFPPLLLF